jgi:hypothetical protein
MNNGDCVEVALINGDAAVRDSKSPDGPFLIYTTAQWRSFLDAARAGDFDVLG